MTPRIFIYCLLIIVCICVFALSCYAQTSDDETHHGTYFDYEKGKIVISFISLFAILGLWWKVAVEVQANKAHRENIDIHGKVAESKLCFSDLYRTVEREYRKKDDCQNMHDSTLKEVKDIRQSIDINTQTLVRLEERLKQAIEKS